MIFDLILLIFLQPFISFIFFFLPPLLNSFFKNKLKELNLKLLFYSLLTDLIFIKPFGFFMLLTSISFLIISFLESFIAPQKIYQKLFFLLIFNLIFISVFLFFQKALILNLLIKFLIFNLIFQLGYLLIQKEL